MIYVLKPSPFHEVISAVNFITALGFLQKIQNTINFLYS